MGNVFGIKRPGGAIGVALLASSLFACGGDTGEGVAEEAVRPVKLVTLAAADSGQVRRYPATVEAAQSTTLAFQVSGMVMDVPIDEAQQVTRGTLLAKLDPRDVESAMTAAQSEFDNAEAEYQRAVRLAEGDAIATSQVEQRKSRRDTARAQLDKAEKALADTVIRAPFDGVIARVHASKRQNVQPQQDIVTVIGTGGFEVLVNLPSSVVATSRAIRESRAFVVLDAAPSVQAPATFKEAALEADSASQTFEVRFTFDAPDDLVVLPGMNATLVSETSTVDPATDDQGVGMGIAVPLSAIASEGDRNYVWVVDSETMTVSKRWVTLTPAVGETAVATEGLSAGETIAGAGGSYLAEGMKVRPWTDS